MTGLCRAGHPAPRAGLEVARRHVPALFRHLSGQWDLVRDDLFGRDFLSSALLSLLDAHWAVGDLGCGTGLATAALAPQVGRVWALMRQTRCCVGQDPERRLRKSNGVWAHSRRCP